MDNITMGQNNPEILTLNHFTRGIVKAVQVHVLFKMIGEGIKGFLDTHIIGIHLRAS